MLMGHDDDPYTARAGTIDDRVRESTQRKDSAATHFRGAEPGTRIYEPCDAYELVEEGLCHGRTGVVFVERYRVADLLRGFAADRVGQGSCARNLATTSSPGIHCDFPDSIEASRRSAS